MIIDTHSHIGNDFYCGNIELSDYTTFCERLGIKIGFLMPTPWPMYNDTDGNLITTLLWEHFDYKFKNYFTLINDEKNVIFDSPYQNVNDYYFKTIESFDGNMQLFYIPLLHGVLDNPNYIEYMIKSFKPKAFKLHGFGGGFSPEEINPEITELLRFYSVPLILHTSVYNYDYGYGFETKYWRNECHPLRWVNYLINNKLRGVLNHGACLNLDSIKKVNESDDLMIGIGPDLDLAEDYFKIDIQKDEYSKIEYLKFLREHALSTKLLFDIDYAWNRNPQNNQIDYNSVERVKRTWGEEESQKILSKNAIRFYNL